MKVRLGVDDSNDGKLKDRLKELFFVQDHAGLKLGMWHTVKRIMHLDRTALSANTTNDSP